MRRFRLAPLALTVSVLAGCASPQLQTEASSARPPARGGRCVERAGLPDPRCTPGAIRSSVSLATICAPGYSRSVRPPESFTEPLKLRQMRAYDLPGSPSEYEEDHLVPLSIGGAPRDPRNLWPQPRTGPNNAKQKDQLETWAARMACSRRIPLGRLQRAMASDWITLYHAAGGERVLHAYRPAGSANAAVTSDRSRLPPLETNQRRRRLPQLVRSASARASVAGSASSQ